jgi:competence protein ComEA
LDRSLLRAGARAEEREPLEKLMRNKIRSFTTFLSTLAVGATMLSGAPASAAQQVEATPSLLASMLAASTKLEGKLNVNTASAKQWELLPGIGPAMAKKLIDYRAKRKFGDLTHVMRIKGIGRATYTNIKPFLTMEGETTLRAVKGK